MPEPRRVARPRATTEGRKLTVLAGGQQSDVGGKQQQPFVIGFTGSFGSGCTTAALALEERNGVHISLSGLLKQTFAERNGGAEPSREELQALGDELRLVEPHGLVRRAVETAPKDAELLAIECIKNPAEVRYLRDEFGERFVLMAVMAREAVRWERSRIEYQQRHEGEQQFLLDDRRDRNEETDNGQAVVLCVDTADILISNDDSVALGRFRETVLSYADLAMRRNPNPGPTFHEVAMHQAYSARFGSQCVKRQVGAVVVSDRRRVVGTGCNENPSSTQPCVHEPRYKDDPSGPCLRDIVRNRTFRELADTKAACPVCGEPLGVVVGPPWRCAHCAASGEKTNLELTFFPDRAMSICTAVHAEVAALMAAGDRAEGGTLYTTTFPCAQCAEYLVECGVKTVVFSELYPDLAGRVRLEIADVKMIQFEGVRSAAFERIYGRVNSPT